MKNPTAVVDTVTGEVMPVKNLHQRILAIMQDISYVQKEDRKVNGQYTFVSHDAVTAKIREFFIKHGVIAIPSVLHAEQEGNTTIVNYMVTFVNVDNPQETIVIHTLGYGVDPQDKGPGKAMSYAYKYAILKMFALETGDDPERDNLPRSARSAPAGAPPPSNDAGVNSYLQLLEKAADAAKLEPAVKEKVLNKYRGMAANMGFAQWKHAVESAMEAMKGVKND